MFAGDAKQHVLLILSFLCAAYCIEQCRACSEVGRCRRSDKRTTDEEEEEDRQRKWTLSHLSTHPLLATKATAKLTQMSSDLSALISHNSITGEGDLFSDFGAKKARLPVMVRRSSVGFFLEATVFPKARLPVPIFGKKD
jgi:hypothetical protein